MSKAEWRWFHETSGFVRSCLVSTQEQKRHGLSVDSQIDALRQFCREQGLAVAGVYDDAGISARKRYTRRPALLRLLEDCRAGNVDVILFTKLDRWFRSVGDYYEVQRQLDAARVPWRAIWEDYETETSAGVFKVNIMLSVAQSEADRTSERIKDVMRFKQARGDFIGKAPTGYLKQGRALVVDPGAEEAVKALFRSFLLSGNAAEAMREAARHGFKTNRETINKILMNPAYSGQTRNGYTCPPYITPEEHSQIVDLRKRRTREPKRSGYVYLFAGLCRCAECGRPMSGKTRVRNHADGSEVFQPYYECHAYHSTAHYHAPFSVTESIIEPQLLENLETALEGRRAAVKARNASADKLTTEQQKTALRARLKRTQAVYMDGGLSDAEYTARRDEITRQIAAIRTEPEPEPEPLPDNWREVYDGLDRKHRAAFWRRVLHHITLSRDRSAAISFE